MPSGAHACVRKLKAVLTDPMTDLVWVQVTFISPSMGRASGCTQESTATAKVRLPEPLGDRDVIVDHYIRFSADGAKRPALRLCGKLGCTPPAIGCTAAAYDQALEDAVRRITGDPCFDLLADHPQHISDTHVGRLSRFGNNSLRPLARHCWPFLQASADRPGATRARAENTAG